MAPLPPPKPHVNLDYYSEQTRGNDQVITRAHSVLPASVRPNPSVRALSPRSIEPDLVAKDRYDPASKCFSYVPARALSEHFTASRKPQHLKQIDGVLPCATAAPSNMLSSPTESAFPSAKSIDSQQPYEPPKWADDIEKITNGSFFDQNSKLTDMNTTPANSNRTGNGPIANSTPKSESSKLNYPENDDEKPVIVEQAKHVSKRRKTNSDLDDLCDPNFYLTYASHVATPITRNASESGEVNGDIRGKGENYTGARATEGMRGKMNESNLQNTGISGKDICYRNQSAFDDYFSSPKSASSLSNANEDREAFRMRNCRSATSAPIYRESYGNRLFAHNRYDSLTDAENADDWLKFQLNKLKAKRENNPEVLRRKRQEKLLLEELKHVNGDRQKVRENGERTCSIGSYEQSADPLTEHRVEEERLQHSVRTPPYHDSDRCSGRLIDETSSSTVNSIRKTDLISSSALPPKPCDIVKHKPPTPPLRPHSRSPSSSPYLRRYHRIRTPFQETAYQRERNQIRRNDSNGNDMDDFDDSGEFSHLKNIVKVSLTTFHSK
ncbi:unnamed protein product [Litomosoides sigmodontis]|uniref:Uncharacterized protein n=1 Tax=Litomosoides sigmodontis TaxID=42156 RepID=A0A3P6TN29_LITSI|nr:unnamed protein product [Litomosoides sigmodontis]